jgi:hypothetical protein
MAIFPSDNCLLALLALEAAAFVKMGLEYMQTKVKAH